MITALAIAVGTISVMLVVAIVLSCVAVASRGNQ